MSTELAERLLRSEKPGSVIIRFCMQDLENNGKLMVSYLCENGEIHHALT